MQIWDVLAECTYKLVKIQILTLLLCGSVIMDTHSVPHVKQGYTIAAPLVDRNLEILGV